MGSYRYEILRETTTDSLIMENNTREKKMNSNVYGIDLGTCNMKIYCKTSNKILNEKNTIALVKKDQIYAYGDAAYAMYEKAPETINVTFPVISGVIADFNNLQTMLQMYLEEHMKGKIRGAEFIVAVPTDITDVEKRAFFEMFYKSKLKPKSVLLCEKPIADAVGLGLDVNEPTGIMVVDIGADTTEISVISLGGLGVMTLTSFFAMFFMGNTSIYNQLVVRDMVSSNSLGSLLSTLLYILGFTLVIEGIGMVSIWFSIHDTLGMNLEEELAFAAFHSISAFCNAGFSTLSGNLGNSMVMTNHNWLFISVSLLIILGGIGFPILVNFKDIVLYHLRHFWTFVRTRKLERHKMQHLYNLNTKIVLIMTFLLLLIGTLAIAAFEWNASFAGMSVADKWTQAFFNATCPRTAGFSSVDLASLSVQTLLVYLFLMWVGGGSQSTAGGVKVNAFAVVVLNLVAVLRGSERVEVFGRELSHDSIRRSNATVVMSLGVLFLFIFILSILEPKASLLALTFECVSALSTVGSSLNLTPQLCDASKLLVSLLMFIGRVGLITLMLGIVKQKKNTKYRYPSDNIIIN